MLVKQTIQAGIKEAFTQVMEDGEIDRKEALDKVAEKIAETIVDAIKSTEIVYTTGLIAPSMGGPVTGTFEYTIT